ncbi:MAG TPA: DUF362 domain-containing protein [Thermotogota bacterium]|nr:DUF362 domain-containing protein [Thermotogota bacterium]HPE42200.1 DUF362 domain-containing protein [Thermotogota bacterium]
MDVYLESCSSYEEAENVLPPLLKRYEGLFWKNETVWVKPNMLTTRSPEEAVTTHPTIVRGVLRFLLDLGVRPVVSDSPGVGSVKKVALACGISQVCQELGVPLIEIEDYVEKDGEVFKQLRLGDLIDQVDAVVNLPKLKTHGQMVLTLGVKNTFGCVLGLNKPAYHLRAKDYHLFADLLIDVHQLVKPVLTILDGIDGMEGNGPSNGLKKRLGLLAACENAYALDHAVASRLHVSPDKIYTLVRAKTRGLIPPYTIRGEWENSIKMPDTVGLTEIVKMPKWLQDYTHRWARVPVFDTVKCIRCKICETHCPAEAITVDDQRIDYKKCIRCYVCHELCPQDALLLKRKLLKAGGQ